MKAAYIPPPHLGSVIYTHIHTTGPVFRIPGENMFSHSA